MIKKFLMRVERGDFFSPFENPSLNKILIQGFNDGIIAHLTDYAHPQCKIRAKRIPLWNRTERTRDYQRFPIFEIIDESFFSSQIIFYHTVFCGDGKCREDEKRSFYQKWTGKIRKF